MKRLTQTAKLWQQWWLNRKRLEIELLEAELRLAREEYAQMNALDGRALELRFGCECARELEPFWADREWWKRATLGIFRAGELRAELRGSGAGFLVRKSAA